MPPAPHLLSEFTKQNILQSFVDRHYGPSGDSSGIRILQSQLEGEPDLHPGRQYFALNGQHKPGKSTWDQYDRMARQQGREAADAWMADGGCSEVHTTKAKDLWGDIEKTWKVDFVPAWTEAHKDAWRTWKERRLLMAADRTDPGARRFNEDVAGRGVFENGVVVRAQHQNGSNAVHADIPGVMSPDELALLGGSDDDEPENQVVAQGVASNAQVQQGRNHAQELGDWRRVIEGRAESRAALLEKDVFVLLRMDDTQPVPCNEWPAGFNGAAFGKMPVWVARVQQRWDVETCEGEVNVAYYGQNRGDINGKWGRLVDGARRPWCARISRDSVLLTWEDHSIPPAGMKVFQIPTATRTLLGKYFNGPYNRSTPASRTYTLKSNIDWKGWAAWDKKLEAIEGGLQ